MLLKVNLKCFKDWYSIMWKIWSGSKALKISVKNISRLTHTNLNDLSILDQKWKKRKCPVRSGSIRKSSFQLTMWWDGLNKHYLHRWNVRMNLTCSKELAYQIKMQMLKICCFLIKIFTNYYLIQGVIQKKIERIGF